MPTKLVPYTDAKGLRHWVEVEASAARDLENFDRAMRRREKQHRARLRVETDVKARRDTRPRKERSAGRLRGFLNVELETAYRVMNRIDAGNPWEGARLKFTHLLGESPTWPVGAIEDQRLWRWDGAGWVCAFCAGVRLESHQYCLGCDRHGRES
jgi:hypothetical protein